MPLSSVFVMDPAAYRRGERDRGRGQTSLRVVSTCLGKNGEPTRILGIHDDPQTPRKFAWQATRLGSCLQRPCTFPCTIRNPTVADYATWNPRVVHRHPLRVDRRGHGACQPPGTDPEGGLNGQVRHQVESREARGGPSSAQCATCRSSSRLPRTRTAPAGPATSTPFRTTSARSSPLWGRGVVGVRLMNIGRRCSQLFAAVGAIGVERRIPA